MSIILGCIADDITGATDIALMLSSHGMRVVQVLSIPDQSETIEADAIVVAQKTRSIPAGDAVAESLRALRWLKALGCQQFFFKYCSTFDSTAKGNIGPVTEALLAELNESYTVACPSFPKNGRKVFNGYLFVHEGLLSESSLKDHPLTPMRDSNLVRVLSPQMSNDDSVGLIPFEVVESGADAIRAAMDEQRKSKKCSIVDAITDRHLKNIAEASSDLALLTGGSALAMGLPENYRRAGLLPKNLEPLALPKIDGPTVFIAGSCSLATQAQVKRAQEYVPSLAIDPLALSRNEQTIDQILNTVEDASDSGNEGFLIYSTSDAASVEETQRVLGIEKAAALVEETLSSVAKCLVAKGHRKLVIAGGETSGAVAQALDVVSMHIGPEIAPGVPWTVAHVAGEPVLLAFKSGNFGDEDFFMTAKNMLP